MNYVVKVKSSCTIYFFYTFGVNTLQCIYVYTNNEILWYNSTYMTCILIGLENTKNLKSEITYKQMYGKRESILKILQPCFYTFDIHL